MSVRISEREIQPGISATTDMPPVVNIFIKYMRVHAADAGDQPYRQMCSAINANANANAHTNQIPIAHRIVQNIWAMGLRWCSLYALELNIFNPLDEPPAEKNLNLAAITDMIIPEKCSIINHEL